MPSGLHLVALATGALVAAALWKLVVAPWLLLRHFRLQGLKSAPFVPLLGQLPIIRKHNATNADFGALSRAWSETLGNVFCFCIGPEVRLHVGDPEMMADILGRRNGSFARGMLGRDALKPIMDQGLLLAEGHRWVRQRRTLNPAFHFDNLVGMLDSMVDATGTAVDRWLRGVTQSSGHGGHGDDKGKGKGSGAAAAGAGAGADAVAGAADPDAKPRTGEVEVDMARELSALTLDIIGRAAFGFAVADDVDTSNSVAASVAHMLEVAVGSILSGLAFVPFGSKLPTAGNRRMWKDVASLRRLVAQVVATRKARRAAAAATDKSSTTPSTTSSTSGTTSTSGGSATGNAASAHSDGPKDLLDLILEARDDEGGGQGLSDAEVRDQCVTFVVAGHETTSQLMSWCLYLLTRDANGRRWWDELRSDVLRVCGPTRAPTYADLRALPRITHCLQESMRLLPPVPGISRTALEDVTVKGEGGRVVHIPKGCNVSLSIHSMHDSEDLWPDPTRFDPSRFDTAAGAKDGNGTGGGGGDSGAANGGGGGGGGGGGIAASAGTAGRAASKTRAAAAFMPFSLGRRNCIGQNFALLEARVMLAMILQRVRLRLSPAYVHFPQRSITLRPKYGIPMFVSPAAT